MVGTRSRTAVSRNGNLIKTKAALHKKKTASALEVAKILKLKREAIEEAMEAKRKAASAVDVDKILRLKREVVEAMAAQCFPLTAKARLAAAAARATQPSGTNKEKKEKKKVVVKYLVSQGYIDHMKAGLFYRVDEIPEDRLAKQSQLFRDVYRAKVLLSEKLRACQQVLLDQYNVFGYAYDAKEVTDDDEDEDEGEGEVVVKNYARK